MAKLTSAALAAHELGLAATFGGILFGDTGLGKSVKVLPDEKDRSRVIDQAWRTYAVPKTIGLITTAATWLIGRSVFGGQFLGRKMRNLIVAKDVALGVTVLSGLGAQVCGRLLSQDKADGVAGLTGGDEGAFARCIARLLDDSELRGALGERGRARMEGELGWHRSREELLRAYASVLAA